MVDSERRLRVLTEAARDLRRHRTEGPGGNDPRLERRFDDLARHAARAAATQRDAAARDSKP